MVGVDMNNPNHPKDGVKVEFHTEQGRAQALV
jgi:hypothetical protein